MAYNSSQEFFLSLVPIQKEDEYKFISYLFHNPDEIHTVLQEQLFDETSIKLYGCIKSILSNNLKVERDILFEYASKVGIEKLTIENILSTYTEFSNIHEHTIKKIKQLHKKRSIVGDIDKLISAGISTSQMDFDGILNVANKIVEDGYDLTDDSKLLTPKQMSEKYAQILIKRKNPSYRRSYGYSALDRVLSRPAAAEEFTVLFGNKGSGKSLLKTGMINGLINTRICVTDFSLEMSLESNMDRLISMRGQIPFDIVTHKIEPSEKDLEKIRLESERISQIPNYAYYEHPSLSLSDYDDMLYMAKKRFKQNNVLPDDEYGISFVDLGSMIEEFSGSDPRELDKAINKLTTIYRRHKQHVVFVLQANENAVRHGRRFTTPEQCDNFTLQYEDILGGSSYSARARVAFAVNRPLLLKRRFMPNRNEEWDLEEDIMWVNVVKENDNTGKLGRVPFVFPDSAFRLIPKEFKKERQKITA